MNIISIREQPQWAAIAISYFQKQWASEESMMVYQDCIEHALKTDNPLPQWYLLVDNQTVVGCAGLVTNDFISRMELYPWLCALFIEPEYRSRGLAGQLIQHVSKETKQLGFATLHLCTDREGFYERYGFEFNGVGYHPWGESSRVYSIAV